MRRQRVRGAGYTRYAHARDAFLRGINVRLAVVFSRECMCMYTRARERDSVCTCVCARARALAGTDRRVVAVVKRRVVPTTESAKGTTAVRKVCREKREAKSHW